MGLWDLETLGLAVAAVLTLGAVALAAWTALRALGVGRMLGSAWNRFRLR